MRRLAALGVLAVAALTGCGSSASFSAGSARSTELSYFPAGSALVLSIVTDPGSSAVKQLQTLIGRFPVATFGEATLVSKLRQLGLDYQNDIRPLLGNPIMLGAAGPSLSGAARGDFLVVWVTQDAGKLSAVVRKLPGLHSAGSHDGARLYRMGGTSTLAIDGATAVLGRSPAAVTSALDRHAHGGGISSADFAHAVAGLPEDALIEAFGDLRGVLSAPSAAHARRIPWVAALRGYAASISASSSGLTLQFRLDTSGGALTSAQLPIAPGSAAPSLAGSLPITVGIKDPAQLVAFVEGAEEAASPASYARFLKRQAAVRTKTGVDLNSLLRLLTGEVIIASDMHTTMGRATVSDPAAAARTLSKLLTEPASVFAKASSVSALGGGFYALREPRQTITLGVTGNQLLVGKASASQLRAFAAAPTVPAAGAQGSIAFRVALVELVRIVLKKDPPQIIQSILSSLGDINGWAAASVTGTATLALK